MSDNYNNRKDTPEPPKPLSNVQVMALVVLFFFVMNGGFEALVNLASHHGPHREYVKP